MKRILLAIALVFSGIDSYSQMAVQRCVYDEWKEQALAKHPEWMPMEKQRQSFINTHALYEEGTAQKSTAAVTIPVVFHIVLNSIQLNQIGGAAGVALRVDSQMAVLNRDFNGMSLDQSGIPTVFKSLYGNVNISFGLAHTKPNGTSTPGYEIITTSKSGFSVLSGTVGSQQAASDAKYSITGGADAWDPTKYLNIWIVNFSEGTILGICPPMSWGVGGGFPMAEVGPTIHYKTFGKQGPGQTGFLTGYNGGRTLVHELGHFFELSHIWGNTPAGSGNCLDDDGIADTPQQEKDNSNCPTFPIANCTNSAGGEMFMNYMDYVYDACYKMFTKGQANVMNADVSSPAGYAYSLSQNPHLLQFPTSVSNVIEESTVTIFPNPTTGIITIWNNNNSPLKNMLVTNILGQSVTQLTPQDPLSKSHSIDLSELPKGVYSVQCIFANGTLTKKIILQ